MDVKITRQMSLCVTRKKYMCKLFLASLLICHLFQFHHHLLCLHSLLFVTVTLVICFSFFKSLLHSSVILLTLECDFFFKKITGMDTFYKNTYYILSKSRQLLFPPVLNICFFICNSNNSTSGSRRAKKSIFGLH